MNAPGNRKPKGSCTSGRLIPTRAGLRARSVQGRIHRVSQATAGATPRKETEKP